MLSLSPPLALSTGSENVRTTSKPQADDLMRRFVPAWSPARVDVLGPQRCLQRCAIAAPR
jgi:hypothetical protein